MPEFLLPISSKVTFKSLVDIAIAALLIYQFVMTIRGRRAAHILTGICALLALYVGAVAFQLELLRGMLSAVAPYFAIAVIVMFQSEIRRFLARLGGFRWLGLGGRLERREILDEIVLAAREMAESRTGALIVIEREIGLRTFVESGVRLDALVSRDLLIAVFQRGSALHDGAVIIQGDRVAAAACFLPLSTSPVMVRRLGTRHRAAIGVTEESDALAIAISEETGQVSVAVRGDLESDLSVERLRELLTRYTLGRPSGAENQGQPSWKRTSP